LVGGPPYESGSLVVLPVLSAIPSSTPPDYSADTLPFNPRRSESVAEPVITPSSEP